MHKISASVAAIQTEDVNLPLTKNDFTAGKFKCIIKKADLRTDKSILKCECLYEGDGIGILTPGKCIAKMPKGQENPNADRFKACLLEKGKGENFLIEFGPRRSSGIICFMKLFLGKIKVPAVNAQQEAARNNKDI